MKIGDVVIIGNQDGILMVTLEEKLDNQEVTRNCVSGLGKFESLRFEVHESDYETILSFYDSGLKDRIIYLVFGVYDRDNFEVWRCSFPEEWEEKHQIFHTWKFEK